MEANDDQPSPAEGKETVQKQKPTHRWVQRLMTMTPAQQKGKKPHQGTVWPPAGYGGH